MQLLENISKVSEHKELEMSLQIALGTALMSTQGIGAEKVNRAFGRAREPETSKTGFSPTWAQPVYTWFAVTAGRLWNDRSRHWISLYNTDG